MLRNNAMSKSYQKLRNEMSQAARTKATAKAQKMIRKIEALKELRLARKVSQAQLAEALKTTQANVSKIEKRTDIYISTLRSYIEGMGGKLEISANFPEGTVKIDQFQKIDVDAE